MHPDYHVSYILTADEKQTSKHVFLKANQCNHKDTESAVGDADFAHVQHMKYSMQMGIYRLWLSIHAILWASWDYVSSDLCSQILHTETNCLSCSSLRTKCNMSLLCTCWQAWNQCTVHLFTEGSPPPQCIIKGILSFCQKKLGLQWKGITIMEVRMLLSIGLKSKWAGSGLLGFFSVVENLF